ncbi:MAG: hypothetical protein KatS3mg061_0319 [Dehalococcoidia bacterium]|nr:MAG: hypothetical protein KatS3mg061_0319 [Dehalococcoidia bacterium]
MWRVALHTLAVLLVLRWPLPQRAGLAVVFLGAVLFRALLLPAFPTSSDDMFRYIWDGRVQAHGINPYRYPPAAPELVALRDEAVWPFINRKQVPTIYPPAAQLAFLALWRVVPDSVVGTKAAFALVDVAVGAVLARALVWAGRSPLLALVYLWHPLPVVEFAHAGHLDPLAILPLVAALAARLRERPALSGVLLGLATLVKFYPALLLGAWWRWREWRLLLAFGATVLLLYLPYLGVGGSGHRLSAGLLRRGGVHHRRALLLLSTAGRDAAARRLRAAGGRGARRAHCLVPPAAAAGRFPCLRHAGPDARAGGAAPRDAEFSLVLRLAAAARSLPAAPGAALPCRGGRPGLPMVVAARACERARPSTLDRRTDACPCPGILVACRGVFARLWPLAARARLRDPA